VQAETKFHSSIILMKKKGKTFEKKDKILRCIVFARPFLVLPFHSRYNGDALFPGGGRLIRSLFSARCFHDVALA
jgi:hypothetical protein